MILQLRWQLTPRLVALYSDWISIVTSGIQFLVGWGWGAYIFALVDTDDMWLTLIFAIIVTAVGVLMNMYMVEALPKSQAKLITVSFKEAKEKQGGGL